jgi:hypothetical protein
MMMMMISQNIKKILNGSVYRHVFLYRLNICMYHTHTHTHTGYAGFFLVSSFSSGKLMDRPLPSISFPIHYSLLILSLDAMYSEFDRIVK